MAGAAVEKTPQQCVPVLKMNQAEAVAASNPIHLCVTGRAVCGQLTPQPFNPWEKQHDEGGIGNMMKQSSKVQENMAKCRPSWLKSKSKGKRRRHGQGHDDLQYDVRRVTIDPSLMAMTRRCSKTYCRCGERRRAQGRVDGVGKMGSVTAGCHPARDETAVLRVCRAACRAGTSDCRLRVLPGVGPVARRRPITCCSATGAALNRWRAAEPCADALHHCRLCNNFSEAEVCDVCASPRRDKRQLAVVEMPPTST